jgi:hypothetical protein
MHNIKFRPGVKPTPDSVPRLFAEDYYTGDVPVKIYHRDYSAFSAPMYGNDEVGDCTIAGIMHVAGLQSKYGDGDELLYTTQQSMTFYEKCWGYVPGDPSTDQGGTLQGTLQYAQKNPDIMPGYNLDAFAQLRDISWPGLTTALEIFGTVYVAVNLPQSAEDQFNAGAPWTYVGDAPVGGHCITLTGFDGGLNSGRFATWGKPDQHVQMEWWDAYGTEAWVAYSKVWLRSNGEAPNGLNEAALLADMNEPGL